MDKFLALKDNSAKQGGNLAVWCLSGEKVIEAKLHVG
jgi:hypothetical protein